MGFWTTREALYSFHFKIHFFSSPHNIQPKNLLLIFVIRLYNEINDIVRNSLYIKAQYTLHNKWIISYFTKSIFPLHPEKKCWNWIF
jgi:hypothetical protein